MALAACNAAPGAATDPATEETDAVVVAVAFITEGVTTWPKGVSDAGSLGGSGRDTLKVWVTVAETVTLGRKDAVGPTVADSVAVATDVVADAEAVAVADGDVVLLLLSTVWDPCDGVSVRVGRDGDRVAKDTVTDGDADFDVDAERPSTVGDSVRRERVSDKDGVPLTDTDVE